MFKQKTKDKRQKKEDGSPKIWSLSTEKLKVLKNV